MDNRQANKMVQDILSSKPEPYSSWFDFPRIGMPNALMDAVRFSVDQDGKYKTVFLSLVSNDMAILGYDMPYVMDETTKKLFEPYRKKIQREIKSREARKFFKELIPLIGLGGIAVFGGAFLCWSNWNATHKEKEQQAKVQEYEKSFPNYNDSIVNAKTDADLQRAVMKQVQKEKMVERFADSLRNKSK